jgi:hypothetical protein
MCPVILPVCLVLLTMRWAIQQGSQSVTKATDMWFFRYTGHLIMGKPVHSVAYSHCCISLSYLLVGHKKHYLVERPYTLEIGASQSHHVLLSTLVRLI